MEWLYALDLNLHTLLLVNILPFVFYGYSSTLWYDPPRVKSYNLLLILASCVIALLILARLLSALRHGEYEHLELLALHLAPSILTLFAIKQGQHLGVDSLIARETAAARPAETSSFSPKDATGKVEKLSWDDVVVAQSLKDELNTVIELLQDPKAAKQFGISVPKGILFEGPPGTGKTTIAKVVANTAGLSFFALRQDEIVSKYVGESERNLSKLFETAQKHAPAVIFIDEIDALGKKRGDQSTTHGDTLLNHLLQLIDGVISSEGIYIIGATNRAELVDEALKRAGRLNRVITIPLPDTEARHALFKRYMRDLSVASDIDIDALVEATDGNSSADIKEICNQAGLHALRRSKGRKGKDPLIISSDDFELALSEFEVVEKGVDSDYAPEPVNNDVEKLSWNDLIIDTELREELQSVVELLKTPEAAKEYGIDLPKGILLNGPPGTGKTTLAKVIANEAGLSFFILKTDEIVSKMVGDSEKNLTRLFESAQAHAPAVLFIDEIDSLAKNRSEGNAQHADSLLNHLLQLIDGVIKRPGIYVIAATNRAELVDPALKRGGRLNRVIEVPLPNAEARAKMFSLHLSKLKLARPVSLPALAERTAGRSGADIKAICNQAGLNAFKRESAQGSRSYLVSPDDLEKALQAFSA
jgi:transitional endoplasmic reticulum ATPase